MATYHDRVYRAAQTADRPDWTDGARADLRAILSAAVATLASFGGTPAADIVAMHAGPAARMVYPAAVVEEAARILREAAE